MLRSNNQWLSFGEFFLNSYFTIVLRIALDNHTMYKKQLFWKNTQLETFFVCFGQKYLTTREFEVIGNYFGVFGNANSFRELANQYNVTGSRVQQIKDQAILKLEKLRKEAFGKRLLLFLYTQDSNWKKHILNTQFCLKELVSLGLYDPHIVIEDMNLPPRAYNALYRNNLDTLEDILQYDKDKGLKNLLNLGSKSYEQIQEIIQEKRWRTELPKSLFKYNFDKSKILKNTTPHIKSPKANTFGNGQVIGVGLFNRSRSMIIR